ncbi:uncharacterized protein LOC132261647 [Phlebotomus argentipes]|nr:uncharacterized protein LOC132261647 [Phlebotomus argentipes]
MNSLWCFAIFLTAATSSSSGQEVPSTPCPSTFRYQFDGGSGEWIGIGRIANPPVGEDIMLFVTLSVGTQLTSSYVGEVKILGQPSEIANRIYSNQPLNFEVRFPIQNPLPEVSSITVNENVICRAEYTTQYEFTTKIRLQYTFKPQGGPVHLSQTRPSYSQNQQPNYNQNQAGINAGLDLGGLDFGLGSQLPFSDVSLGPFQLGGDNSQFSSPEVQQPPQQQHHHHQQAPQPIPQPQPRPTRPTQPPQRPRPQNTPSSIDNKDSGSSSVVCGKPDPLATFTPLIVGGTALQRGTWPWLVAVHVYKEHTLAFQCGATLISQKVVIGAAHCFADRNGQKLKTENVVLILGQYNLKRPQEEGSQIVYPESINNHPQYMSAHKIDSDISVVVIARQVEFTQFIRPVCLWSGPQTQDAIVGRVGVVVGWGRDEHGNVNTPEPKKAEVPVVSDATCLRSNEAFSKITTDRTFCGGWRNGSEGPCNGDSGGGLIFDVNGRWTLRGIVSASLSDMLTSSCNLKEYVVFTDVAKYSDWIRDKMITSLKRLRVQVDIFLVVICALPVVRTQGSSPCPNLFQYQHNGYEAEGALEVPAPPIGTKLELHVFLTVPVQLPSSYVGALELRDAQEVALDRLKKSLPVRYRVKFPISNPVPRLVSITYNGNVICQGDRSRFPNRGSYVTNIRLDHTLTTRLTNEPYDDYPARPGGGGSYPQQDNYYNDYQNYSNPFFGQNDAYNPYGGNNFIPQQSQTSTQAPYYPPYQEPHTQAPPPPPPTQRPSRPSNPFLPAANPAHTPVNRYGDDGVGVCGKIESRFTITPLIFGGEEFPKGSWPWLVAIHVYKGAQFSFVCGGTLVSHNVIVSAAHCFMDGRGTNYEAADVIVFVGKHDLRRLKEDGATISEVQDLNIHPEFLSDPRGSFDADIAVLVLKESVEYSAYIRPVCLWSLPTGEEHFVGKTGVVVGWGRDEKGNLVTYLPKRTQIPLVSTQECINSRDDFATLTSARTICGGWRDGVNGPCTGDSGGGLIMYENGRWQLRGVISIAIKHPVTGVCDLREYVVFTDAAKFTSWIRSFMTR